MGVPDKNKAFSWKKYKEGMCKGCSAVCCTMPVEVRAADLVRLGLASEDELQASPKKVFTRLSRQGILHSYRASTELFMLVQRSNSDCVFLNAQTRLCTVYDKRPDVCRSFPSIGLRPGYCPCDSGK